MLTIIKASSYNTRCCSKYRTSYALANIKQLFPFWFYSAEFFDHCANFCRPFKKTRVRTAFHGMTGCNICSVVEFIRLYALLHVHHLLHLLNLFLFWLLWSVLM